MSVNSMTVEGRFAYYTESNLATLEMLKSRRGSSKSDINRQQNICNGMIQVCRDSEQIREYLKAEGRTLPRLCDALGVS